MTVIVTKPRIRVKAGSDTGSRELVVRGEGDPRPGPWFLPVSGGWLPAGVGDNLNWWQMGYNVGGIQPSAMVEACVSAYAQTVAMCPGDHWQMSDPKDGRKRVTSSALSRILKGPNAYQTISDFLLNAVRDLYENGNIYALALRNSRYEISELHLMNPRGCSANIAYDGSIFYSLSGNPVIERMVHSSMMVPARDVWHVKLNTSYYNPLLGESPIIAAARDIASGDAMAAQQLAFYMNQARPSTVLSTEMTLDATQVQQLRDRWNEQSRGLGSGGTPILTAGLKPVAMPSINANDSQLAQIMKMNEQHIALAFRIPLQVLGMAGGGPVNSTEALMQNWLASSLGFCLNHLEESFGQLFSLGGYPNDYLEFDTSALLRSAFKERVEGLVHGVQGGIFEPNYARADFGLPAVKFGDEPRVQQQVVPLSAAGAIPAAPTSPSVPSQPSAAAVSEKDDPDYVAPEDRDTIDGSFISFRVEDSVTVTRSRRITKTERTISNS